MTSCTVEVINAAWSALAFLLGALGVVVAAWRALGAAEHAEGKALVTVCGSVLASAVAIGFHTYGQDALRYVAADSAGHECRYDRHGSVKVIRGDEPAEEKP